MIEAVNETIEIATRALYFGSGNNLSRKPTCKTIAPAERVVRCRKYSNECLKCSPESIGISFFRSMIIHLRQFQDPQITPLPRDLPWHFGGLENVSDYRIGGGAVEFGFGAQR